MNIPKLKERFQLDRSCLKMPVLSGLFISPSTGISGVIGEDQLKSYLAIGTLASALRPGTFLQHFTQRMAAAPPAVAGGPPMVFEVYGEYVEDLETDAGLILNYFGKDYAGLE